MIAAQEMFQRRLLRWYRRCRRDLPWRVPLDAPAGARPDPYHVLVSEAMLQQTQVATVVGYFNRFIACFPTIAALAEAPQQQVLRQWQGLGYYSRARNLQAAAVRVVNEHGGQVPQTVEQLLALPGVGRYTAGAIASLAFSVRAPIVDGNVARVLCRIDAIEQDPRASDTQQRLWRRAEQLLPRRGAGDFNSALMELGATVCTPRNPRCGQCPVWRHCDAAAQGAVQRIPPPRTRAPVPLVKRWTLGISRDERWLIEQRPPSGRWASLWQFVTLDRTGESLSAEAAGAMLSIKLDSLRAIGKVRHALTHRRYEFEVHLGHATASGVAATVGRARRWVRLDELDQYPLSRPQLRIARMLREHG